MLVLSRLHLRARSFRAQQLVLVLSLQCKERLLFSSVSPPQTQQQIARHIWGILNEKKRKIAKKKLSFWPSQYHSYSRKIMSHIGWKIGQHIVILVQAKRLDMIAFSSPLSLLQTQIIPSKNSLICFITSRIIVKFE